jgi:hypothetical protein
MLGINFLALSHICENVIEFEDIILAQIFSCVSTLVIEITTFFVLKFKTL